RPAGSRGRERKPSRRAAFPTRLSLRRGGVVWSARRRQDLPRAPPGFPAFSGGGFPDFSLQNPSFRITVLAIRKAVLAGAAARVPPAPAARRFRPRTRWREIRQSKGRARQNPRADGPVLHRESRPPPPGNCCPPNLKTNRRLFPA